MFQRAIAAFLLLGSVLSFAASKPNVILITLDSIRSDRIGFLGAKQESTPNLDNLARQSIIFEQAYAQAPTTVVSHATILTGTYPQTHHASELGATLSVSLPYLPDLMRARGYRTAAFVQSTALNPRNGVAQGFDRGFGTYNVVNSGAEGIARATEWLGHNHDPGIILLALNAWDAALSTTDANIGKLLTALRNNKLFDDALIVVTASHGGTPGAHGEDYPGVFLYDETIHVPLLVKLPQNQDAGKRIHTKVPLVNIAPTILETSGVPVPSQMQGQSLIRIAKGNANEQPIYSRGDFPAQAYGLSPLESWRAGKFLYIRAPKPELYDLSADPAAMHNLAATLKATLDTMASQLGTFNQHFKANPEQSQLTSSQMQKLASLGYVGVQKPTASVNAATTGTDPKDAIAAINKISSAARSLETGKFSRAQQILEGSMSSYSTIYLAQYVMGTALSQQQKYPQAIPYLHRAIELQPDSAWAHYQMGGALLKTSDYKTAAVHLEIAAERLPNFTTAHALLAQAYEHLGRAEDAKREKYKAAQQ
ncbi:MAG TPA: sulfatase-like hydrolase/transferase [Terriglobales bacterium]|nr:sulfatase-like hydrolase/transferase [Terriglobales bacterium]